MIGIVAGVGPYAGLDLLDKILSQTVAAQDQDHLTVVSISQPAQIPDRTAFLLGHETLNPAFPILEQLLKLEQAGAQVAAIPCNTAHAPIIFDKIQNGLVQAGSQLNLLHMIVEVGRELQRSYPMVKKVGVLSTTGTAVTRIYPLCLERLGFELLALDTQIQAELIHPAIYDPVYGIKANGRATERARSALMFGVRRMQEAGAQAVVLGCTELPLAIHESRIDDLIMIDPALILARALISAVDADKLKQ
ncbi:MAG: amino acid racemase [Candidatus Promineifilaceae bacterium]|nr:amino acid racemase [Candidatus Promineifilaceae bacterium]